MVLALYRGAPARDLANFFLDAYDLTGESSHHALATIPTTISGCLRILQIIFPLFLWRGILRFFLLNDPMAHAEYLKHIERY